MKIRSRNGLKILVWEKFLRRKEKKTQKNYNNLHTVEYTLCIFFFTVHLYLHISFFTPFLSSSWQKRNILSEVIIHFFKNLLSKFKNKEASEEHLLGIVNILETINSNNTSSDSQAKYKIPFFSRLQSSNAKRGENLTPIQASALPLLRNNRLSSSDRRQYQDAIRYC